MDSGELKTRTLHAILWTVLRSGTSNLLGFVIFTILARLLSPAEFGVFALAILVTELAKAVAGAGLGDAIIRDRQGDEVLADTVFWANLALGCCVGALAWLGAPCYAWAIGRPEIITVLRCLAVLVPVSALGGIHTARKLRVFGYKAVALRTVGGGMLGGAAAVAAALGGLGVWSLVIQAAIIDIVGVALAWQTYPWRPRMRFDPRRLAAIFAFSGTMMLTQVLGMLLTRIQDLVIGRFISVAAVGSYRISWRMIDLIAQATVQPAVNVSFVTLAHLQDDRERFRRALLRLAGLAATAALPAITGFGVLSGDIVPLLFGTKWASSAPTAGVLSLMAAPYCINLFAVSALAATGRPGSIARSTALQATAALALALLAAPFGVQWVAAAYVLRAYLALPYCLLLLQRDTGVDAGSMLRSVAPPLLAAALMAATLLLARPPLHGMLGHGVAFVTTAMLSGGLIFTASLLLLAYDHVRYDIGLLLLLYRRHRPGLAGRQRSMPHPG